MKKYSKETEQCFKDCEESNAEFVTAVKKYIRVHRKLQRLTGALFNKYNSGMEMTMVLIKLVGLKPVEAQCEVWKDEYEEKTRGGSKKSAPGYASGVWDVVVREVAAGCVHPQRFMWEARRGNETLSSDGPTPLGSAKEALADFRKANNHGLRVRSIKMPEKHETNK